MPIRSKHALLDSTSLQPAELDDFGEMVDHRASRLEGILDALAATVRRIQEDRELTQQGRATRVRQAAEATEREIKAVGIPPAIDAELRKLAEQLPDVLPVREVSGPFSVETRHRLVLDRLMAIDPKDPLAMQNHLRRAARAGDAEVIVAAQRAPRSVLTIGEELMAEVVAEYWRAVNPAAVARRESVARVKRILESNLASAIKRIEAVAGLELVRAAV